VQEERESELALGREGRFGLVDQVEASRVDAGLDELKESLAVGKVVQVAAIAGVDGLLVPFHVAANSGVVLVFFDVAIEARFELFVPPDEVEEVFGPEEEAFSCTAAPSEAELFGEWADFVESRVLVERRVAYADAFGCDSDGFEQTGLSAPVFADEKEDIAVDVSFVKGREKGEREREIRRGIRECGVDTF